jgi:hypothetical protein
VWGINSLRGLNSGIGGINSANLNHILKYQILVNGERLLDGGQSVGHLEKRLMEIDGLWKLKPSSRARRESGTENILPSYEEVGESSGR